MKSSGVVFTDISPSSDTLGKSSVTTSSRSFGQTPSTGPKGTTQRVRWGAPLSQLSLDVIDIYESRALLSTTKLSALRMNSSQMFEGGRWQDSGAFRMNQLCDLASRTQKVVTNLLMADGFGEKYRPGVANSMSDQFHTGVYNSVTHFCNYLPMRSANPCA